MPLPSFFEDVPASVRCAGGLVSAEGLTALVIAVVLAVRGLLGQDDSDVANGYGTALWFGILGAAVFAGGFALVIGRRWGRAIAIVAQLLLLPVVWALLTDSHQPVLGGLLGVVVVATLILLLSGPSARWMAQEYSSSDE